MKSVNDITEISCSWNYLAVQDSFHHAVHSDFIILKQTNDSDDLEKIELKVWKEGIKQKCLIVNKLPRNQPDCERTNELKTPFCLGNIKPVPL